MNHKLNLFNERDWLNPSATKEPVLWIREVRLLYRFEPGDKEEIRRVVLHRGVNIIWAKPADPDEADGDKLPAVGEALFVDAVVKHAKQLGAGKRAQLEEQLAKLKLDDLESALEATIGATALAKSRYDELSQFVQETKDALARVTDNKKPSQQDVDALDAIIAKLKPDRKSVV